MFWFVFALMALLAAGFVLLAFARPAGRDVEEGAEARGAALKAQLAEADRDLAQNRLNEHEHSLVRAEIARRLFKMEDEAPQAAGASGFGRPALVAAALVVPVAAGALYFATGSPGVPSRPFADRTDLPALVARAESALRVRPNDPAGWLALAPIYRRLNRPGDAARAYTLALEGEHSPRRRSALLTEWAEAETASAANPSAAVNERLKEAVQLDADNVKARFLLAAATEMGAEPEIAAASWQALLDRYPTATEGWVEVARARLARLEVAKSIPAAERGAAIDGMVASLAERLQTEPDDLEGWTRLIRSYAVLGRAGAARSAYERARSQFDGRVGALAQLSAEATRSGIAIE